MKLHYLIKRDGKTLSCWEHWKEEKDCTPQEKEQANLRTLKEDEVILDIDKPDKLNEIIKRLIQDEYSFEIWETGSRGYHIQMRFPEMEGGKNE